MRTPLCSKLAVYKAVILFSIAAFVGNSCFYIFSFKVNNGVAYFISICFALQ